MAETYRIELACCESVLLQEIGAAECKQKDVALTYAMALCSSEAKSLDWRKVNEAIAARWSQSAVERIKVQAWKLIDAEKARREVACG